jgi:hypothetical protein
MGPSKLEVVMSERNSDIVRRAYEAFGRGDLDGLLGTLDDNIVWVTPGPSDLPTAGRRQGREEVRAFFGLITEMVEFQKFDPHTFVEQGDRVVVLGDDIVTVKATGKVIEEAWAHAFTLRDGKVIAFQEFIDTASMVAETRLAHARA